MTLRINLRPAIALVIVYMLTSGCDDNEKKRAPQQPAGTTDGQNSTTSANGTNAGGSLQGTWLSACTPSSAGYERATLTIAAAQFTTQSQYFQDPQCSIASGQAAVNGTMQITGTNNVSFCQTSGACALFTYTLAGNSLSLTLQGSSVPLVYTKQGSTATPVVR